MCLHSADAYRFRDNEYKSNVRSTLHNTGAFSKTPTGGMYTIHTLNMKKSDSLLFNFLNFFLIFFFFL